MTERQVIYVAAPYSHIDSAVTAMRVDAFLRVDQALVRQGYVTVSPIAKHFILNIGETIPGDWKYWQDYSLTLLKRCDELFVVMLPGWDKSEGVAGEVAFAKQNNIPVRYVDEHGVRVEGMIFEM